MSPEKIKELGELCKEIAEMDPEWFGFHSSDLRWVFAYVTDFPCVLAKTDTYSVVVQFERMLEIFPEGTTLHRLPGQTWEETILRELWRQVKNEKHLKEVESER